MVGRHIVYVVAAGSIPVRVARIKAFPLAWQNKVGSD